MVVKALFVEVCYKCWGVLSMRRDLRETQPLQDSAFHIRDSLCANTFEQRSVPLICRPFLLFTVRSHTLKISLLWDLQVQICHHEFIMKGQHVREETHWHAWVYHSSSRECFEQSHIPLVSIRTSSMSSFTLTSDVSLFCQFWKTISIQSPHEIYFHWWKYREETKW